MNYLNKGKENEQWLYHGTKLKKSAETIIETGLDARLSNPGYLGYGIYCTDNSALADQFTDGIERTVFYGRFLLGETQQLDYKTFSRDSSTRIGPPRTIYHEGEDRNLSTHYDSVGALYPAWNCPFWAIFSNDQTYPDYLVYYRHV